MPLTISSEEEFWSERGSQAASQPVIARTKNAVLFEITFHPLWPNSSFVVMKGISAPR